MLKIKSYENVTVHSQAFTIHQINGHLPLLLGPADLKKKKRFRLDFGFSIIIFLRQQQDRVGERIKKEGKPISHQCFSRQNNH